MNSRSDSSQFFLLLLGTAVLTALAIARLPRFPDLLRPPSTPFDRSAIPNAAADYRLFRTAAAVIPAGTSVSALSQPRNPERETDLHRGAVAFLPGRRVLPAALWNTATGYETEAEFLVVAGPAPSPSPGTLLVETPEGSVWRRVRS